jgi:hypothetical protein
MFYKSSVVSVAGLIAVSLFGQPPGPRFERADFSLVRPEFGISNKVVQGAPYSAQAVTQFTHTLANGDHIQRTTTGFVARDSQGRTRTERSFGAIGALSAGSDAGRTVMIFDPVASKSYVLDPASRTVRSTPIPAARLNPHVLQRPGLPSTKAEELGTQVMQGVNAEGKRVTRVIPAGKEGNEKEIDIVTETWYSPDLQVVVMSKTSDPRYGDSVYQLTGIARTEPDPALFAVPSDYTMRDYKTRDYKMREGRPMFRRGLPPAQ